MKFLPSVWRMAALWLLNPIATMAQEQPQAPRSDTVPQKDLMDVLYGIFHSHPKVADTVAVEQPKVIVAILPAFSASPTVGVLFGVSGNALSRLGPESTTTASTISASVSYTTKKQFNVLVRTNIFTSNNDQKFEGDWRYQDTNQPTFGLGPAPPESAEAPMDFKLVRLYETIYRQVVRNVMLGIGYHLNYYFNIVDQEAQGGNITPFLAYNNGQTVTETVASGWSFNVLSDTRDNPLNPRRGLYTRGSLKVFPTWLGSDDNWQSAEFEIRAYPKVTAHSNFAFWSFTWLTLGRPPYLDLPAIGWDFNNRTGRGYQQGRIRANDLVYGELEYRTTLTRNGLLGAVAFVNVTSTNKAPGGSIDDTNWGYGAGLRIRLNKRSGSNITLDYGFGAEGSKGLFMGTGEVF